MYIYIYMCVYNIYIDRSVSGCICGFWPVAASFLLLQFAFYPLCGGLSSLDAKAGAGNPKNTNSNCWPRNAKKCETLP